MRNTCKVDGCERFVKGHGLCNLHYQRWKNYGDPEAPYQRMGVWNRKQHHCNVEGCDAEHFGRGYCKQHYNRWYHSGDPGGLDFKAGPGKPTGINTYKSAHDFIGKAKGKASAHQCVDCGGDAEEWSYINGTGWTLDPADYEARCVPCHRRFDASLR